MYGKANYYLGARAKAEGRRSLFPSVDVSLLLQFSSFMSRLALDTNGRLPLFSFVKTRKPSVLASTRTA